MTKVANCCWVAFWVDCSTEGNGLLVVLLPLHFLKSFSDHFCCYTCPWQGRSSIGSRSGRSLLVSKLKLSGRTFRASEWSPEQTRPIAIACVSFQSMEPSPYFNCSSNWLREWTRKLTWNMTGFCFLREKYCLNLIWKIYRFFKIEGSR